ncbi:DNA cytosine methyltransferase [Micromonospora sp. SCSIO 07396]
MQPLTYLSLFSGIGGLDLGLDRAGWHCAGQVELDPFCRSVLTRHWPEVPKHDDVRTAVDWWTTRPRPPVRLVAGGFPCQPFSTAGLRRGTGDPRWGWPWFRNVVRAVRPDYVLVENVAALLDDADAFGWMLGDPAEDGFDADWTVLSACAVGAPHTRERLFVLAHANRLDGTPGLGTWQWPPAVPPRDVRAGAWLHPIDGLMEAERRSGRVADGLPDELEPARVKGLGNAVVPAVGEFIGRMIAAHACSGAPA